MAIDVRVPGDDPSPKARLWVDTGVAALVRKVAKAEGLELSEMLERLVAAYARERGWEVVEASEPAVPERRATERRSPSSKGAVRPLPPAAERRRKQRRS